MKHGMRNTKVYRAWRSMIIRCTCPQTNGYERYGGRGIRVCDEWRQSFLAFLEHVGHPPSNEHQLDRIDTNGNYEPGNVRWATRKEQARNRRSNVFLTAFGKTQTLCQWAAEVGIDPTTIAWRISHGSSVEDAVTRQPSFASRGERNGSAKLTRATVERIRERHRGGDKTKQLAADYGVSRALIYYVVNGAVWR